MIKTLKNWNEIGKCITTLQKRGICLHETPQKNWDILNFIEVVEKYLPHDISILDVGCSYCPLLEIFSGLGYEKLYGIDINFNFKQKLKRIIIPTLKFKNQHINFSMGDLTKTKYLNQSFELITSLSVIEHGIDLDNYFKEMSRILKPGGVLLTTTDFWKSKLDTAHIIVFNYPMKVFICEEIIHALNIAEKYGLIPLNKNLNDYVCDDTCVTWNGFDYTFLLFGLKKI